MTFDLALRTTEILLAAAFLQQSAEHIIGTKDHRALFLPRAGLSVLLLFGVYSPVVLLGLALHSIVVLHRFDGPYNGGSDKMGLLVLYCLCMAEMAPYDILSHAAFGYLGVQVILSYFISGQVKIMNPAWRSGRALQDVFHFSAYPVSEDLRQLANRPTLLWIMSWAVILFEVLFPLSMFNSQLLIGALIVATAFHIANACLFGLNRFVWFWIAAYPSVLWLQHQIMLTI